MGHASKEKRAFSFWAEKTSAEDLLVKFNSPT